MKDLHILTKLQYVKCAEHGRVKYEIPIQTIEKLTKF